MNQTAVEWFQDQIIKIVNGTCELSEIQIFDQAKAMEKQQIMKAVYDNMGTNFDPNMGRAEQYYNEMYNK
jgi:hypothetical protein